MNDQTSQDARRGSTPADPGTNLTNLALTDADRAALYPTVPADPPAVDLIERHLMTATHYYGPPAARRDEARALYAALTAELEQARTGRPTPHLTAVKAELERTETERNLLVDAIGRMISMPPRDVAKAYSVRYGPGAAVLGSAPDRAQGPQPGRFCPTHWSWLCQAGQGQCQAAGQPDRAHGWTDPTELIRWPHCSACGVIRRHDDQHGPCKGPAPVALRPADWEQRATEAVRDAVDYLAVDSLTAGQIARTAVRAIIGAGLAGPGGRCPQCGSTYPRTMPAGEDARCWTCSTEDQTTADGCGTCWTCRAANLDDPAAAVIRAALDWRAAIDHTTPGKTPRVDLVRAVDELLAAPACVDLSVPAGEDGPAHDHTSGLPLFDPDATIHVNGINGVEAWTGAEWNDHARTATRNGRAVPERMVLCPRSVCTTTCPADQANTKS